MEIWHRLSAPTRTSFEQGRPPKVALDELSQALARINLASGPPRRVRLTVAFFQTLGAMRGARNEFRLA
jgi:hypothetical protein